MEETHLLYVDDEEINLILFEISFKGHFRLKTTHSPIKALEIVKENKIKVVISDYKMPYMNGMELIREIKKLKPEIVCIILSGYVETDVTTDNDLLYRYILKPWKFDDMKSIIKNAMRNET